MHSFKKKIVLLTIIVFCCIQKSTAQNQIPADSTINLLALDSGRFDFSTILPPLTQIPGAPNPFYTHLWDFGDGHFSTEANPQHSYAKPGEYDVYLYAVNNYDDGKKPGLRKRKVTSTAKPNGNVASISPAEKNFFKANNEFEIKYNSMAKPNDTMVLMVGWKNIAAEKSKGKLYLLLNEKAYSQTCFDTIASRFFNNENFLSNSQFDLAALDINSSLLVTESGSPPSNIKQQFANYDAGAAAVLGQTFAGYKNSYAVDLGEMLPGENHFSFVQLHVTPEMIKDTNATVVVTGVYVPEKGRPVMHKLNIPVVNSHDPNKMNLKGGRLSYRFLKKEKKLSYKVRFQNTGKGPARKVALDMSLYNYLDPQTIQVKDLSPYCEPCRPGKEKRGCWELEKNDSGAVFTFHGIYLPGTDQKGIEDKDSTQGFMEFYILSKKKLQNKPFRSRTAIYFDNNPPVITNYATGRFKRSPSPSIMAGYEMAMGKGKISNGITTGFAIAPLAPHVPYLQFELYYKQGLKTSTESFATGPGSFTVDSLDRMFDFKEGDSVISHTISQLKFIPLHLRYNINDYIGIGVGVSATVDIGGSTETTARFYDVRLNFQQEQTQTYSRTASTSVKAFQNWKFQPFVDLQLGKVRLGPHLGFRYYYNSNKNSFGYFYAGWRL